jgi:general secretion pathway protein M
MMADRLQRLTVIWADRTGREKVLLITLAGVAAIWGSFAGVWQPLQQHRAALLSEIIRFDRAATVLQMAAQSGGLPRVAADTQSLPVIIAETAASLQLVIRRLQPVGDQVQITLEDAPFDAVLVWIDTMERDHGLVVQSLDLVRRPAPGVVGTSLTVAQQ